MFLHQQKIFTDVLQIRQAENNAVQINFQKASQTALQQIAKTAECLATLEGLTGHQQAIRVRLK